MQIKPYTTIYVAHPDFVHDLIEEIADVSHIIGNLIFSPTRKKSFFALDIWYDAVVLEFESISAAAKILRAAGKFWYLNPLENIRRSRLIESELRKVPSLNIAFPSRIETQIGVFSLLDKNTLIFSTLRWKKSPIGYIPFIEDRLNPPNRAYLKLWEALSLMPTLPQPGETALDLGASPGGWTWVMQSLGTSVTAIDKAPLAPAIAAQPNVTFLQQSAFALDPSSLTKPVDWLVCDVACYPQRSYDLAAKWIASGNVRHMILTVKLQGKTDFAILEQFAKIPEGNIVHLFWNKHEVTFLWHSTVL